MSKPFAETLAGWVLDIVFGERSEPLDAESVRAGAPPRWMNNVYGALLLAAAAVVLFSLFARLGWLLVDYSPTIGAVGSSAVLASLLLRLAWEPIQKHYAGRGKARMTPTHDG